MSRLRITARGPLGPAAGKVLALTASVWMGSACFAQAQWDPQSVFADPLAPGLTGAASGAGAGPVAGAGPELSATPGPIDQATIDRLLGEAESAYRAGRWGQALESFKAVTAFDADNPQAWLRIGNLNHRRGQLLAAASAYRRAATNAAARGGGLAAADPGGAGTRAAGAAGRDVAGEGLPGARVARAAGGGAAAAVAGNRELRAKALVNLASVNLELATTALDEARATETADASAATVAAWDGAAEEITKQLERIDRMRRPGKATAAGTVTATGEGPASVSAPSGPSSRFGRGPARVGSAGDRGAGERGTGDRGTGDRGTRDRGTGGAASSFPADASDRPSIEYLRGAPKP